ncbi:MAG: translocation/assembly module TamB domain-containing protein [Halieaceae bacterium]|nr:translocation/assembly module TamB domain-containing protein [Halieaceae bacterium]
MLWRLLLALVLLPLLGVALLPFTGWGSKLVLSGAGRLLPLEIEYRAGTLAGELELARLAWVGESLQLELTGLVLELAPGCLWHSSICFRKLRAQQLTLDLLPGTASDEEQAPAGAATTPFEFPVPMEAASLYLDALAVRWQGGEWRQGIIQGPVAVSGSTIRVGRARVERARLALAGGESDGAVALPQITLPLELLVEELLVEGASWDLDGQRGELHSLGLAGQWRGSALALTRLELQAKAFGHWQGAGDIDFSGQWPLELAADGVLPEIQGWPAQLGRELAVSASGDLGALALHLDLEGELALAVGGMVNVIAPELPFSVTVDADWPGELALPALLDVPESLASVAFTAPLRLAGSGDLNNQAFQLETTVAGLGYQGMALRLAGSNTPGKLALEDLRLQDSDAVNTLWGRGVLDYSGQLAWSAQLETSGIDLLPLAQYGSGRIEGQLQFAGSLADDQWSVSVSDADLTGTLNGLPARLSGSAGIDSHLVLLPGELEAELNGTRLSLRAFADPAEAARLELALDDLGRWLPDSHGEMSLQGLLLPGWEELRVSGTLGDIQWQALRVSRGRINGHYGNGKTGSGRLDIELSDLSMAGFELASLQFTGSGDAARQAFTLRSRGDLEGLLALTGAFGDRGQWSGRLAPTTLQTAEGNWYLGEELALEYSPAPRRLQLAAHCWQYRQSRVCPGETVLAQEGGSASMSLDGDLEVASAFLPEYFELGGWVVGQIKADWSAGNPLVLDGSLHGRNLSFTRHFSDDESGTVIWESIDARLRNGAGGLSLNSAFYSQGSREIGLELGLPPDRGQPLTGALDISGLQLSRLAPFAPTMSVLDGVLRGRLQLAGTLDRPLAQGTIQLTGGHFAMLGNPTELRQMDLQLDARGDNAVVRGSGKLGGGELSLEGTVLSRPEWRVELAIDGERHEILLPPFTTMLVSEKLAMTLTGGLLDLEGDIVVLEGTLQHEQLPEGAVRLSADVVEVDLEGNVIYEAAPFDVTMRIGLLIEDRFRIVGDTVNATVGGDLRLRQQPRQPLQVFGNLNVMGGELRAFQQRLRITRGTVSFAGTPDNPELEVRAQREIPGDNVVVGLELRGTLNQPRLEVFSDPVMSHGETMSYLIRGRGLDTGAGADGVAMALSLGSSLVNQSALVTELNRIPGLNNIAFGAEGSNETDTAATVGGYIGQRLYLSYGMGIYQPINVLTARLYLSTRLWLEVVSRLENSVDLYYSFDIN